MTASEIRVENLSLRLGDFQLRGLDFSLDRGEILVLLGPNGAGKSVTLEAIAGFHRCETGRVAIGGREVTREPPERRNVGFLFQNFALFPHLTVLQNIAFGRHAARARPTPRRSAGDLLQDFGIAHLASRHPEDLSPGEKQRTALARALVTEPALFLFDEPFSALDLRTRDQLRDELHRFLRSTGIPTIFVTHDHTDAMVLADKVVVMRQGSVVQAGGTADVFRRPANPFVAEFLGVENVLSGRVEGRSGEHVKLAIGRQVLLAVANGEGALSGSEMLVAIRGENVDLHPLDQLPSGAGSNRFTARIAAVTPAGILCRVTLDCGFVLQGSLMTRRARDLGLAPGQTVAVEIDPAALHLVPRG